MGLPELGDEQGVLDWLVLDGDRLAVAGALLLAVFGSLVAVEVVVLQDVQWPVPLLYVYSAQVGGNLTLITLVLSITQLVLSRQLILSAVRRKDSRSKISGAVAVRP